VEIKEHEYVRQTLERYTNCRLEDFCDHVLITNFKKYIHAFKDRTGADLCEGNFRIVNAKDLDITMIDFGIGSPQAALIINCLAYQDNLKSVIMLVPDMPLHKSGIKDKKLHAKIYEKYMDKHLDIAFNAVESLQNKWSEVEDQLSSEW
jgi:hypothetical protein